jgi:hypothetical protein
MKSRATVHVMALSFSAIAIASARDARASDAPSAAPPPNETPPGAATPQPSFGDRGELVIGTDATLSLATQSYDGTTTSSVVVEPSIDYFAVRHLSIGGALIFSYEASHEATTFFHDVGYGIAPRIGYDIPISDHFSLWPKASAYFTRTHDTIGGAPGAGSTDQTFIAAELFVPVLFHPAPHFFVGFGPYAESYLTGANETFLGAKLTLGGWLDV